MSGICDTCKRNQVCRKPMDDMNSCRLYVSGKESNYSRLFGTPEKTAEYFALRCFGSNGDICGYCPLFDDCDEVLRNSGSYPNVHGTILKWLESDGGE